ncbi:MAG: signal peptidase I [Gammaproteobacteria bacterium]|nr:signal peptidase I [Gammaproteobacteria bacterium]
MRFDFPTIMVLLVAVSGGVWLIDELFFARGRRRAAEAEPVPAPRLVEYARSFFPVFLIVLLLRSFLVEPFRIPSASMMPTLVEGDFILVNKYTYGIRLPITDTKIVPLGAPERGDVVVFRAPETPDTPYIKRVVGIPGDEIAYRGKQLFINGQPVEQKDLGTYVGKDAGQEMTGASLRIEQLPGKAHEILLDGLKPSLMNKRWTVPEGHYFVLGDNRDNSHDSRYWNFVPDENLIGKAFIIWLHYDVGYWPDLGRIGTLIQ